LDKKEKNKIVNAVIIPALFVAFIGGVHLFQFVFEMKLTHFGVFPRSANGLIGIIASPLLHGDFKHLFNNSIPLLILGTSLFYFYKEIALKVTLWIYVMVGVWTWVYAREAYHIGASGLLYGLFSFLLVSGFIRRNNQLIALSFAVIFLYGSLVWGIFPIDVTISFEGHLWGFVAGIVLAIYYRKQGPQRVMHEWDDEEDIEGEDEYWKNEDEKTSPSTEINYIFRPKGKAPPKD
jgi:membrane associated rhomboid family serine protease